MEDEIIFGLDVGTRSVVGILAKYEKGVLRIFDYEALEHNTRSMKDGQVNDVRAVARDIMNVKKALESRNGVRLTEASIAVAGRNLRTMQARTEKELGKGKTITKEEVKMAEIEAVNSAVLKLRRDGSGEDFFPVGYTVVGYAISDTMVTDLVGQKGSRFSVSILATFLPKEIVFGKVESLRQAMLSVKYVTIEPIVGISVAIPAQLRNLNLAFIDVGAGTTDIAVTKSGAIRNFAMVPFAGDEITEKLSELYLLDFSTAEAVKKKLTAVPAVEFENVLGKKFKKKSSELMKQLESEINSLTSQISDEIIRINGAPPDAVFCAGGGSLTPKFTESLSKNLGIKKSNITIKTPDWKEIKDDTGLLKGPEFVTPVGIVTSWANSDGFSFFSFIVEGRQTEMLGIRSALTVEDALLAAGIDSSRLFSRPGMGISITVNNETRLVRGEQGKPSCILVNGEKAELGTRLEGGETITVESSDPGKDAQVKVKDVISSGNYITVRVNGVKKKIPGAVKSGEKELTLDDNLQDNVQIEILDSVKASELAGLVEPEKIKIMVNGTVVEVAPKDYVLKAKDRTYRKDDYVPGGTDVVVEPVFDTLVVADVLHFVNPLEEKNHNGKKLTVYSPAGELKLDSGLPVGTGIEFRYV